MEEEKSRYGAFVVYNGVSRSCGYSKRSGEFLLGALYGAVGREKASQFMVRGAKEYLGGMSAEEVAERIGVPIEVIMDGEEAHAWVINREVQGLFQAASEDRQRRSRMGPIDRYKALEISKSIIFKHLNRHRTNSII